MPTVGRHDVFESSYRSCLKALLAPYGQLVEYAEDRVTLDLGLHLYAREHDGDARVGNVRVWFQCKGIRTESLSVADILAAEEVSVGDLPVDHVQFWYSSPEPVYLCVYLEATETFITQDVRDLVDELGGMSSLVARTEAGHKTMTLKLKTDASLEAAVAAMPRHRSLRIDGPAFRGRPLGHRYDPLRSELAPLLPKDFLGIVDELLDAHQFERARDVPLGDAFGTEVGAISAFVGTLFLTYEWINQLETEFGFGADTAFRVEGPPNHAQGKVLVAAHSEVLSLPAANAESRAIVGELVREGFERALIFINRPQADFRAWGAWRFALDPQETVPQSLGSLAFNVLTTTCVYLDFLDRLKWRLVNYL